MSALSWKTTSNLNVNHQEEEEGLVMLPSAFLSDIELGHKTFAGMFKLKQVNIYIWLIIVSSMKFRWSSNATDAVFKQIEKLKNFFVRVLANPQWVQKLQPEARGGDDQGGKEGHHRGRVSKRGDTYDRILNTQKR